MRVESKEQWYQYQSHITDLMLCHITSIASGILFLLLMAYFAILVHSSTNSGPAASDSSAVSRVETSASCALCLSLQQS